MSKQFCQGEHAQGGVFAGLPEPRQSFALRNEINDKRGLKLLQRAHAWPLQGYGVSAPPESPGTPERCRWMGGAGWKPSRETEPTLKWQLPWHLSRRSWEHRRGVSDAALSQQSWRGARGQVLPPAALARARCAFFWLPLRG